MMLSFTYLQRIFKAMKDKSSLESNDTRKGPNRHKSIASSTKRMSKEEKRAAAKRDAKKESDIQVCIA